MAIDDKDRTFFKLKSLHQLVLSLRRHCSHSASSLLLWGIVDQSVRRLIRDVERLDASTVAGADLVRRLAERGDNLHLYLGFLEAGEANRIPNALVSPLHAIMQPLAPGSRVVVWCGWIPGNYSAEPKVGECLKRTVEDVFRRRTHHVARAVPDVLAVLSFPAAERDNVLLHSALGHELGHVLLVHNKDVDKYPGRTDLKLDEQALRAAAERIDAETGAISADAKVSGNIFSERMYRQVSAFAAKTLARWRDELFADAYSVYLLGPAPVLALYDLAGLPGPSPTHPPGYLRFLVMLECLRLSGFAREDDNELGWLAPKLAEIRKACDAPPGPSNPVFPIIEECVSQHTCRIADYVMGASRDASAAPYTYADWARCYAPTQLASGTRNCLVDRLLNYVIPDCNEAADGHALPASLASILNSGWALFYGHWDSFCKGLGAASLQGKHRARQRLFNLLLKGIESSDLSQRWGRGDAVKR